MKDSGGRNRYILVSLGMKEEKGGRFHALESSLQLCVIQMNQVSAEREDT